MARSFIAVGEFDSEVLERPAQACDGEFTVTASLEEALSFAGLARPSAVLVDARQPGYDTFIRAVRADPGIDETPIVAVVGSGEDKLVSEALGHGADDFVVQTELGVALASKLHAASVPPEGRTIVPPRATLLCEASPIHRTVFTRLLEDAGFVVTVVSAEADLASALTGEQRFELIILDLGLPGGPSSLADQVVVNLGEHTPPIIGTAHARLGQDVVEAAYSAGFKGVHDKRRPPEELVFLAAEAVDGRSSRREPRALFTTIVRFRTMVDMFWHAGWSHNFSAGGLFVRTIELPPIGEVLDLQLTLAGGASVDLQGLVTWRKDFAHRAIRSYPTGMGIAFSNLTDAQRQQLTTAAAGFAKRAGTVT